MKRPRDETTIAALLTHKTQREAAQALGVSEVTLWRRQGDPAFQRAYRMARRRLLDSSLAQLQACTPDAVETIRAVMTSGEASMANKLSAARLILDQAARAVQVEELEERIAALEEQVAKHDENIKARGGN